MDLAGIKLPDGFHIQKTGGRPRKDAKFIAMVMAFHWRVDHLGEKVWMANEWILDHWKEHGISTGQHLRAVRTRMTKGPLAPLRRMFFLPDADGFKFAITPPKSGWLWKETMHEAYKLSGAVHETIFKVEGKKGIGVHVTVDLEGDTPLP